MAVVGDKRARGGEVVGKSKNSRFNPRTSTSSLLKTGVEAIAASSQNTMMVSMFQMMMQQRQVDEDRREREEQRRHEREEQQRRRDEQRDQLLQKLIESQTRTAATPSVNVFDVTPFKS